MWSRRQLLAALGASGASLALGGWLGACGGAGLRSRQRELVASLDDVLLQVLQLLDGNVEDAFVWSQRKHRHRVSKDSEEQHFDLEQSQSVVFGGQGRTVAMWNATPAQLMEAAKQFVGERGKGELRSSGAPVPSQDFKLPPVLRLWPTVKDDPASRPLEALHKPVASMFSQAQDHGSSRIIYRNSFLLADEIETRMLSREQNQERRELRIRLGVLFAAWTGDEVVTSVAERAATGGLDLVGPSKLELEASAEEALAHLHARSAPAGLMDVILSPSCAALVSLEAVAKPAFAQGQRAIPKGPLRLSNDPTLKGGYGSYSRDDLGHEPRVQALFGDSNTESMQAGAMRRDDQLQLRALPANLIVEAGTASEQELVADVKAGVYLEGPLHCSVDPEGSELALLCGRGREIRDGRFTGRLFGRLLASAACSPFFDETRALGQRSSLQAFEESSIAMSVRSPAWLTRAQLRSA